MEGWRYANDWRCARPDRWADKEEAAAILGAPGLTISDACRMILMRTVADKALPFDPLVPNAETIEAMKAARRGDLVTVGSVDDSWPTCTRTIRRTVRFQREAKGRYRATLDRDLRAVISLLAADVSLPEKHRDHALTGDWKDHRDCHIRPDLVLIDRKPDADSLELVRLGSPAS
jgi:mRNA interferase YafQ